VKGTGGGLEPLASIDRPLEFRSEITGGREAIVYGRYAYTGTTPTDHAIRGDSEYRAGIKRSPHTF
jgi:hypothetical protein